MVGIVSRQAEGGGGGTLAPRPQDVAAAKDLSFIWMSLEGGAGFIEPVVRELTFLWVG